MIVQKSCFTQQIPRSFIPFAVGSSYSLLKGFLWDPSLVSSQDFLTPPNLREEYLPGSQNHEKASFESGLLDFIFQVNQNLFGIYSNLFAFLLVMLLIDMIAKCIQNKTNPASVKVLQGNAAGAKKRLGMTLLKTIMLYSLIFLILQTIKFCINGNADDPKIFSDNLRILEGESAKGNLLVHQEHQQAEKISLSMGTILSSLNIDANAMILSRDKKTAFVTLSYYGTLKIIDISDLQAPNIIGSLRLKHSGYVYRIKTMVLSSDEKTLFLSNTRDLEIVNVRNLKSPQLLSRIASEIFDEWTSFNVIPDYFRTSLALDEKSKTLFIGGLGLQIYDISSPIMPMLISAEKNNYDIKFNVLEENEIWLSQADQVLFMAYSGLNIYNISNPREMSLISTMASKSSARSLYLEDPKTLLLVGVSYREDEEGIVLEELDISNYSAPIVRKSNQLGYGKTSVVHFLGVSPQKTKYFLFTFQDLIPGVLVFDSLKTTVTRNQENLLGNIYSLVFSQDGKNIITTSNGQFVVVELLLEYPNSQTFGFSNLMIGNISLPQKCQQMKVSPDGKTMFIVLENDTEVDEYHHKFEIWNLTEINNPTKMSSISLTGRFEQMHFPSHYNTAYLLNHKGIDIIDVSKKSAPEIIKSFHMNDKVQQLLGFQILSEEKTAVLTVLDYGGVYIRFFNLSKNDSEEIKTSGGVNRAFQVWNYKMLLKDDKTLIVVDNEISIYNISNFESASVLITSIPLAINEPEPYISSCVLSPDTKTLFLETYDQNMFTKLSIYDISRLEAPRLITEQPFSKYNSLRDLRVHKPSLSLSPDANNGFVFQDETLVRVNLTDLKQPRISGIIRLTENKNNTINNYVLSPDSQLAYVITDDKQINIVDINVKYTLYLKQERFLLGQKYSDNVVILGLTNRSDYELMDKNASKIIKLSLLDIKVVPNKFELDISSSILPSWIVFDNQNNMLTLEPKKQRDLGIYTFLSIFSLKIPMNAFDGVLGEEKNSTFSEDLLAWLVSLDYIDNQLFLTGNFGSFESFLLPAQFNRYKKQIYEILKKFYVETCTLIEIAPSLELKDNGKSLMISTLSFNTLRVEIKLSSHLGEVHQHGAQFLSRHYASLLPVITEEKTKLFLEGTLKEINAVFELLVVNFAAGSEGVYNANITISDAFNPTLSVGLSDISRYFRVNKSPTLSHNNKTVQDQIGSTNAWTGEYYIMTFDKETFRDEYSENLNYEIAMAEEGVEVPNWLSLSGLTLRGTPPEEIFGRNIDLVLIAKNEFKECREPFRLHVKISSVFMLKLILKYSPYILTLVGLLVSANKIFNILGKRIYKHPKEYVLNPCEEIIEGVIFPIFFVRQEKEERNFILKHLVNKGRLLDSFIDSERNELDKQRIIEKIEGFVGQMSREEKKKLELYCSAKNSRKVLIQQLVIDKMLLLQLSKDKKTKEIFEKMKDDWIDVVYWDVSTSKFALNLAKFDKLLEEKGVISNNSSVLLEDTNTSRESLLNKSTMIPGVNLPLLKDSLLAYSFEQHQINKSPLGVEIHLKQQVPSNCLWRFLKFDLRSITVGNKNKVDYGINYRVAQSMLSFCGITSGDLEGKTIIVQITNTNQKILKEIWIYGNSDDIFEKKEFCGSESSQRGKSYEVY